MAAYNPPLGVLTENLNEEDDMKNKFALTSRLLRAAACGALLALTAAPALASAVLPPPPPPPPPTCSNGSSGSSDSSCPGTSSGGFNQAITNAPNYQTLNIVSGAAGNFGNQLNGGTAIGPGSARFALGGEPERGAAAAGGAEKWNVWFALSENRVAYDFQPLRSSGHVDILLAGVDYTWNNRLIVGAALSGERTRVGTSYNNGNFSSNGTSFAPYLAWAIDRNWVLDAALGFGNSDIKTTDNSVAGGANGSTRDRRSFAALGLSYNRPMGKWQLTGKGQLMSAEDRISQYTLSNNTNVLGSTARTTQLRIGGQAAYRTDSMFTPFAGLTYIYDIDRANQGTLSGQNAANDRDAWLLQAGVNFQSRGRLYGSLVLSTEQGRSQVKNDQVLVNLGFRF